MRYFFRGGRELPQGQGDADSIIQNILRYRLLRLRLLADDKVTKLSRSEFPILGTSRISLRDVDLSSRPKEQNKYVILTNRSSRRYAPHDDGGRVWQMPFRYIGTSLAIGQKLSAILTIFCVLFSLVMAIPAFGQEADGLQHVKPLMIGQRVPDEFWTKEHLFYVNGDTVRKTLEEYKGKMIVFDFWATWCGSCLRGIMKNLAAQEDLNKYVSIVYVTSENEEQIGKFINNNSDTYGTLSSVVADTLLKKDFPYRYLPHIVWITKEGIVKDISGGDALTLANVKQIFEDSDFKLPGKRDVDIKQPLFLLDNMDDHNLRNYQIIKTGEFEGLPVGLMDRKDDHGLYAVAMYNRTISDILKILFYKSKISGFHASKIISAGNKERALKDIVSFEYLNRIKRDRIYKDAILFLLNSLDLTVTDKGIVTQLRH